MSSRPHPPGSDRVRVFQNNGKWVWACMNNGCHAPLYSTYGRGVTWAWTLSMGLFHIAAWHATEHLSHDR